MPDWDRELVETWEERKARRARERAGAAPPVVTPPPLATEDADLPSNVAPLLPHPAPALRPAAEKRPIAPINITAIEPGMADVEPPVIEWVDPRTLLVDGAYQRDLSEGGLALIRRIITRFDWRRFKPPICARLEEGLEVIDGQHTAIAAASHPEISLIPIVVVCAVDQQSRAQAFIGHNRDRLNITPMQMHFSAVAAGDEDALTIDQVAGRAGAKLLKSTPPKNIYKPRETVAIPAIGALIRRRGAFKARICLQVLADAELGPIKSSHIKAAEMLLHGEEYAAEIDPQDLTAAIRALGPGAEHEAAVFAAAHKLPLWRALGVTWFKKARIGRRRSRSLSGEAVS